jgi:phosphoribosylglycinamide formyltransferase-1
MTRIAVFCSGGGTNLQALLDAQRDGLLGGGEIVLVVTDRRSAFALERARAAGVEAVFLSKKADPATWDSRMVMLLLERDIDLIVLAGYLSILGSGVLSVYARRILNTHPALLPSFGGMGMYGHNVHEAVLAAGCKVSGSTVHFVEAGVDEGPIVLQRAVDVLEDDTPETLAARVLVVEHQILPAAVALYCRGKLTIVDKRVRIG